MQMPIAPLCESKLLPSVGISVHCAEESGIRMVNITCDVCGKKKPTRPKNPAEEWLLGYDLQVESETGLLHSVRFLDHWDDRRVLELGAIHLCSEKCMDKYLELNRAA